MLGNQNFNELDGASWVILPAVRMQWMAAASIGASKTTIRSWLALGGERARSNQGYLCG